MLGYRRFLSKLTGFIWNYEHEQKTLCAKKCDYKLLLWNYTEKVMEIVR